MKNAIVYHKNCFDGAGAAWAVVQGLGVRGTYGLFPINYGETLPDFTGYSEVTIVDWCPPKDDTERLIQQHNEGLFTLRILDHHKTAHEMVSLLPRAVVGSEGAVEIIEGGGECIVRIDQSQSGAVLAWREFNHGPVPWFLRYIEDRDLWRWALPNSKEINAGIRAFPQTIEGISAISDVSQETMAKNGAAVLACTKQEVDSLVDLAKMVYFRVPDNGAHEVWIVNCSTVNHISDVGHELAKRGSFGVSYFVREEDDCLLVSLRSVPGVTDVSAIAKKFGGGGHAGAARFVCSWENRPWVPPLVLKTVASGEGTKDE